MKQKFYSLLLTFVVLIKKFAELFFNELIPASVRQSQRAIYSGNGIFFAHKRTFFVDRTFAVGLNIFASKYKQPVWKFLFYIKSFVCGINPLHKFKFFFGIHIQTVNFSAAFPAHIATSDSFVRV